MRDICSLTKKLLDYISPYVVEGVTTQHINDLCEDYTTTVLYAESAPFNYKGFPKSICTSVNNVICHGIPSDYVLKNGDIINVDVTLKKKYNDVYHFGDSSKMFLIGDVKQRHKYLCDITEKCLYAGIECVKDGNSFSLIGKTIERIAISSGFSVVKEYCGHGIGTEFHMEPSILHYKNDGKQIMKEGMIFTIEPMLNELSSKNKVMSDGWTVKTRDGGYSAQFEHTILVTKNGYEVLTK